MANVDDPFETETIVANSTIVQLRALLATRKLSASEVAAILLDRIERSRNFNIYITELKQAALRQAEETDARIARGNQRPLDGIPIAIKDNYCTKGIRTTAGSKILEDFVPTYESTITQKLLDAGAVFLGKTNMDEFAMGSSTESSYFGPTINPLGAEKGLGELVPGGSSGGSAAAVSAGLAAGALGTDTGGSVRQPASFCGVVGFKPTYGLCSRWGIIAYGSSLDQAGVFGKCVSDVAILMDAIAGEDAKDTTSVRGRSHAFEAALETPRHGLRVAFPKEILELHHTNDAELVWNCAKSIAVDIGAEIVEVSMPNFEHALPAYYIIALSEASSNLARYDGVRYGYRVPNPDDILDMYERTRREGFGDEVKRRIMLGTYSLSAGYYEDYFLKAAKVRTLISREFEAAFEKADVMFMPTAPTAAFKVGGHAGSPLEMYLQDIYTVSVNLAGLPAISIPVAKNADGMPLGLQLIGPRFGDEVVLRAAEDALEAATTSHH